MMLRVGVSLAAIALAAPAFAGDKVVRAPVPAGIGGISGVRRGGRVLDCRQRNSLYGARVRYLWSDLHFAFGKRGKWGQLGGQRKFATEGGLGCCSRLRLSLRGHPWHVNMQARGGEARGSAAISAPPFSQTSLQIEQCCDPPIGIFTSDSRSTRGISNTSAELKESHWQADFGMDMISSPV